MELLTRHLVKNTDIGMHGNLFGGFMMQYLDEAGAILAMKTCESSKMVTKFISNISFDKPVHMGDIVEIMGDVELVGRTSITLKLEANRVDFYTNEKELVCSTNMTFVRISKSGKARELDLSVRQKFEKLGKTKKS